MIVLPAGTSMTFDSIAGVTSASAPTSTGLTVLVESVPATAGGPAPYASDLNRFARAIAEIY